MFPLLQIGPFLVQMPGPHYWRGIVVATAMIERETLHLNPSKLFTRQWGKAERE